jgi:MFS family permease
LLCSGANLLFGSLFMIGPLAPLFSAALGAPPAAIGVVISAAFLFPFFLAIPAGSLVDTAGPKPMLLFGTGLLAASPWLVVAYPSIASLLVLQVLAGLGQLIAVVAAQSLVAAQGEGTDRERNFGWYGTFVSAGQLAGPVMAGVLVDVVSFRAAFAVAGMVAALGTVAFLVLPTPPRPTGESRVRRRAFVPPRELLALTRLPSVQISLWVSATVMVVIIAHGSFLPAYLDELAVPASIIGVILSARSFASIVIRPFMAQSIALFGGRFRSFMVTVLGSAVGIAGIATSDHIVVLLAASLLLGFSIGISQPLTMVSVVEQVESSGHGVAFGLRITINRSVQFVAPLVLGAVAQFAGYVPMFLVASMIIAATAGLLAWRRDAYR